MMFFFAWSILWDTLISYYIDTVHHLKREYSGVEGRKFIFRVLKQQGPCA